MTKPVIDEDVDASDDAAASNAFVQSLERGLAVIAAFDVEHPQLTLSEAARRAGVTRAAARRLLHTLVKLGYVRSEGRQFMLRPKVLELGYAYLSALSLPEIAVPYLKQIAAAVEESAYLSVLDDDDVVCVANVPMRRIWTTNIVVGTRLPAFATAAGRVILADLDDDALGEFLAATELRSITPYTIHDASRFRKVLASVRKQGFALVDHELEEGLRSVAVPIRGDDGVVAAVSVSTLAHRADAKSARDEMLPPLISAARSIERDMGRLARSASS